MLSKSRISFIKSLHQKKFRNEHGLFIVEGIKSVTEFIRSDYEVQFIFHTPHTSPNLLNLSRNIKAEEVSLSELEKISTLTSPKDALALVKIPDDGERQLSEQDSVSLILDGIQDPGNMGTIIRTAEWFGFKQLICSLDTVEVYNPKVVQATMGSLSRIKILYTDLESFLSKNQAPVYGTLLNGRSIYKTDFLAKGLLILGNEGNGIRPEIQKYITHPVTIPRFGEAESLNVAIAAAICCSEIRRRE
ncbi:RNA methyltransferase [Pedobacter sp. HMF7647]|uniref:RNA methyltransferase n=1 Tax=Hufsiella arboris TaxID=2695275 RepID=A0A7K1YAH8_9SPHI|nr:RNA methyltransferase [Hufsiella arboris]MXV51430.1 RNA methyltransferase [Hufsiella arboris]